MRTTLAFNGLKEIPHFNMGSGRYIWRLARIKPTKFGQWRQ